MTALSVFLEDFDDAKKQETDAEVRLQQAKAEAFSEGYRAGETAARTKLKRDDEFLSEASQKLCAALNDFDRHVNAQLCESLLALLKAAMPNLAERGFAYEAVAAFKKNLDINAAPTLNVSTPAAHIDLMRETLTECGLENANVTAADNADLDRGVVADWGDVGLNIDLEQTCADMVAALERTTEQLKTGKV